MGAASNILVWLDLEMTGLNPDTCAIVQAAIILTDAELNRIADPLEMTIWQPESVLATMTPFVRSMHEKSGLLSQIKASTISVEEAEHTMLKLVSQHAPYRTARLCGNSIYQDRRFLTKYMPAFEQYLHYRQVDVSSIKELASWWKNVKFNKSSEGKHTALRDIEQAIEELKFYRERVFLP